MGKLEQIFERGLWNSRLIVVVAVVASTLLSLAAFYMATVDTLLVIGKLVPYADPALESGARGAIRDVAVAGIVKAMDGYLIAAIVFIFGLGLYELFVNRIDPALGAGQTPRLLQIASLDDLKDRVAKLILLVLIIEFFQYALKLKFDTPIDLLYLAVGILLIGGALYLSGPRGAKRPNH
jgi:uncharacterized membrane protein YqhA